MGKAKARIKTRTGRMIVRLVTVTEWIDRDGRQSATAQIGRTIYIVVDRDFYGPVWAVKP